MQGSKYHPISICIADNDTAHTADTKNPTADTDTIMGISNLGLMF